MNIKTELPYLKTLLDTDDLNEQLLKDQPGCSWSIKKSPHSRYLVHYIPERHYYLYICDKHGSSTLEMLPCAKIYKTYEMVLRTVINDTNNLVSCGELNVYEQDEILKQLTDRLKPKDVNIAYGDPLYWKRNYILRYEN